MIIFYTKSASRKLFQLKTSTPLLIQWSHCLWRNSQRDQKCYQHLPVTWWGTSNGHQKRRNLLLHCKRMAGLLVVCYLAKEEMKKFRSSLFLLWKQEQKMMRGKLTWYTQLKIMWRIIKKKHVLEIRSSLSLAKNIKQKDLVFALLNREIIEALAQKLFAPTLESSVGEHAGWLFLVAGYLTVTVLVHQSVCWSIGILFAYCSFQHFAIHVTKPKIAQRVCCYYSFWKMLTFIAILIKNKWLKFGFICLPYSTVYIHNLMAYMEQFHH